MDVNIKIYCEQCGMELDADLKVSLNELYVEIKPCSNCLQDEVETYKQDNGIE